MDDETVTRAPPASILETASETSVPSTVRDHGIVRTEVGFTQRYTLGSLLGAGGMGEVVEGEDHVVGRRIAVKRMIKGRADDAVLTKRFLREARIQGQLDHPAIVPVHELGLTPEGQPYFVMKRVRGRTLREILDGLRNGDGDLVRVYSTRKLLTAFSVICQAVDFAHERGVVHRDVKPSNIILGDAGEVYLIDWGIAGIDDDTGRGSRPDVAVLDAMKATAVDLTDPGTVLGTPSYMAPEQAEGHSDARSDIFALGATLFEIVTRERFRSARRAPPPSTAAPELLAIAARATAPSPDDRPRTANELHEAIEHYLDGDRDRDLRRRLADERAEAAARSTETALANNDDDARKLALHEIGRALAFDPENASASTSLARLLSEPPSTLPRDVEREWSALAAEQSRRAARNGGRALAVLFLFIPIMYLTGIKSYPLVLATLGALILAMAAAYRTSRAEDPEPPLQIAEVCCALYVASLAFGFGPLLFVPTSAAVMAGVLSRRGKGLRRIAALFIAALLVPFALEMLGLVPSSYAFEGGNLVILSRMIAFPPAMTLFLLALSSISFIVSSVATHGAAAQNTLDAQQRLFFQSWQLRHLGPSLLTGHGSSVPTQTPSTR